MIKDDHGLGEHDKVPEKLMPSSFQDENSFLSADNTIILKRHYMKYYLQLRKQLLVFIEDLITQDSLAGSTFSTVSKKSGSNVNNMSTPNIKSEGAKLSKS